MQRSTAVPQGLPSTSALSRHAIYQSCYLRSGAHAGAATPIAPPGRWRRVSRAATGARRLRLSVSRLRVSVPARCGVWTTRKCRRYCIHLMSPSTQTPTLISVVKNGIGRCTTPALARALLAQSNKESVSRRTACVRPPQSPAHRSVLSAGGQCRSTRTTSPSLS